MRDEHFVTAMPEHIQQAMTQVREFLACLSVKAGTALHTDECVLSDGTHVNLIQLDNAVSLLDALQAAAVHDNLQLSYSRPVPVDTIVIHIPKGDEST